MAHHKAQGGVGFSRLSVDVESFARSRVSFWECFGRGLKPMPCQSAVAVCQSRIGRGIARVFIDRLLEILPCLLHALARSLVPVIATLQVRLICFGAYLPRRN